MELHLYGTLLVHRQLMPHLPIHTHSQTPIAEAAVQGADLLTSSDTVQVSKVPHDISDADSDI